jgi:hypothetical protein
MRSRQLSYLILERQICQELGILRRIRSDNRVNAAAYFSNRELTGVNSMPSALELGLDLERKPSTKRRGLID